jgi:hypothetical protein
VESWITISNYAYLERQYKYKLEVKCCMGDEYFEKYAL